MDDLEKRVAYLEGQVASLSSAIALLSTPEQPEGAPASMPVEPMADLSASGFVGDGRDWETSQDGPLNSLPNIPGLD